MMTIDSNFGCGGYVFVPVVDKQGLAWLDMEMGEGRFEYLGLRFDMTYRR